MNNRVQKIKYFYQCKPLLSVEEVTKEIQTGEKPIFSSVTSKLSPDAGIVATLWRQLSWSHFKLLPPIKYELHQFMLASKRQIKNRTDHE